MIGVSTITSSNVVIVKGPFVSYNTKTRILTIQSNNDIYLPAGEIESSNFLKLRTEIFLKTIS
jgi:hypothetical protein